jgi:hypothetical protein
MHGRRNDDVALYSNVDDNPVYVATGSTTGTNGVENISVRPLSGGRSAVHEVWGDAATINGAFFLGTDTLALIQRKKVTLHSLTDEAADVVVVVERSDSAGSLESAWAVSPDGAAFCLSDTSHLLSVFDIAVLRVNPLSPSQCEAQLDAFMMGAAFSDDGARLLTMCASC